MGLKKWNDGEKAEIIKTIIEENFKIVGRYLQKNVKAVTTEERYMISNDHLSNGLVVFDTTLSNWFEYNDGTWTVKPMVGSSSKYVRTISVSDWVNKQISIPYEVHAIPNPTVQLFLTDGDTIPVLGGVAIDDEYNITLNTDLPFKGKVVIQ